MSKEQWGNGYWKGREDERKDPEGYRYIGVYDADDPYINCVGQIHEKRKDALIVEWINYIDVVFAVNGGYEPSWVEVNYEKFEELKKDDLDDTYKFFYSWGAVVAELIKMDRALKERKE